MLEQNRSVLKKEEWGVDLGKAANKLYNSISVPMSQTLLCESRG